MTDEEIYKVIMDCDTSGNLKRVEQAIMDLFRAIGEMVVKPIAERLVKMLNTLEPYQVFELTHPRKKPRGSLRRIRREIRNERFNKRGSN